MKKILTIITIFFISCKGDDTVTTTPVVDTPKIAVPTRIPKIAGRGITPIDTSFVSIYDTIADIRRSLSDVKEGLLSAVRPHVGELYALRGQIDSLKAQLRGYERDDKKVDKLEKDVAEMNWIRFNDRDFITTTTGDTTEVSLLKALPQPATLGRSAAPQIYASPSWLSYHSITERND